MIDFSYVKNYDIRCGYTDMFKQIDVLVSLYSWNTVRK